MQISKPGSAIPPRAKVHVLFHKESELRKDDHFSNFTGSSSLLEIAFHLSQYGNNRHPLIGNNTPVSLSQWKRTFFFFYLNRWVWFATRVGVTQNHPGWRELLQTVGGINPARVNSTNHLSVSGMNSRGLRQKLINIFGSSRHFSHLYDELVCRSLHVHLFGGQSLPGGCRILGRTTNSLASARHWKLGSDALCPKLQQIPLCQRM